MPVDHPKILSQLETKKLIALETHRYTAIHALCRVLFINAIVGIIIWVSASCMISVVLSLFGFDFNNLIFNTKILQGVVIAAWLLTAWHEFKKICQQIVILDISNQMLEEKNYRFGQTTTRSWQFSRLVLERHRTYITDGDWDRHALELNLCHHPTGGQTIDSAFKVCIYDQTISESDMPKYFAKSEETAQFFTSKTGIAYADYSKVSSS